MLIVEYNTQEGLALPDGYIEEYVRDLVDDYLTNKSISDVPVYLIFSNSLTLDCVRLMIAEGSMSHMDVTFKYKGAEIKCDKYGRYLSYPLGFDYIGDEILDRLLDASPYHSFKEA